MKPFLWPKIKQPPPEPMPSLRISAAKEELTGIVKGYEATDIEERMYIAFLHNGIDDNDIEYQPSYLAGRNMAGEIRPDFATYGGLIQVWFADGEYFHKTAEQKNKDETNDQRLWQIMNGRIEFPIRIPGADLSTQEEADAAVGEYL